MASLEPGLSLTPLPLEVSCFPSSSLRAYLCLKRTPVTTPSPGRWALWCCSNSSTTKSGVCSKNWLFTRREGTTEEELEFQQAPLSCGGRAHICSPTGRGVTVGSGALWAVGWCGQTLPIPSPPHELLSGQNKIWIYFISIWKQSLIFTPVTNWICILLFATIFVLS